MTHLVTPRHLEKWLTRPSSQLGDYFYKIKVLNRLNEKWKCQSHIMLSANSTIINWNNTILTLAVDNNGWATRLHYMQSELLNELKNWSELESLTQIKGYVKRPVAHVPPSHPILNKPHLSETNRQLLKSVSQTLSHAPLSTILNRLAERMIS